MNLADELDAFAQTEKRRRGPKCSVCALPQEFQDVIHAKRAEGVEFSVLGRFLKSKGFQVDETRVSRHCREKHDAR